MTYHVPEHVVFREIDDTVVALNLNTGNYYTLNEVGSRIWIMLYSNKTSDDVVDQILSEYDVTSEVVEQDLAHLLEELTKNDLIVETRNTS